MILQNGSRLKYDNNKKCKPETVSDLHQLQICKYQIFTTFISFPTKQLIADRVEASDAWSGGCDFDPCLYYTYQKNIDCIWPSVDGWQWHFARDIVFWHFQLPRDLYILIIDKVSKGLTLSWQELSVVLGNACQWAAIDSYSAFGLSSKLYSNLKAWRRITNSLSAVKWFNCLLWTKYV